MKTATMYRNAPAQRPAFSCPNSATRRQVAGKVVDFLLTLAIGIGVAAVMLFLLALA